MSYPDGHAGKFPLRKIKSVIGHQDYVPTDDSWCTTL